MNKKGFTLIELLTVIAILGILVLLAAPKFLGYTEKANIIKIQTGIKSVETVIALNSIDNPNFTKDWVVLTSDELKEINESDKLMNTKGLVEQEDLKLGSKYIPSKELDSIKWNSGGDFILAEDGENIYYYNKNMNISKDKDGSAVTPGETNPPVVEPEIPSGPNYPITLPNGDFEQEDGTITTPDGGLRQPDGSVKYPNGDVKDPDGMIIHPDGSITTPDGIRVPIASDLDFTWTDYYNGYLFPSKSKGYYKYTGTEDAVVMPTHIEGNKITSYYKMFSNSNVNKVVSLNKDISNMAEMFEDSQATVLDLSNLETSNVTDMGRMFANSKATVLDLSKFDTSNVENMSGMFEDSKATTLDLSKFDTSNVKNMSWMFGKSEVKTLDLKNFDTSNVTAMYNMFTNSKATTLDLSKFDTSKVEMMGSMFEGSQATTLDLSSFDTSNVRSMERMFANSQATTLDLSKFDTSKVEMMNSMFEGSQATTLDLSSFDTSNVRSMERMFANSQATTLDLSKFNISNVQMMHSMFANSKATTGYAKSFDEIMRFESTSDKPGTLTFTIK